MRNVSVGILAGMWPCGILVMLCELFTSESKSQVYAALHELLSNHSKISSTLSKYIYNCQMLHIKKCCIIYLTEYICYDDGCHLRKYARNPVRSQLTPITIKLANLEIVIDKMHMAGHIDKWCLQNCNPRSFADLNVVSVGGLITVCACDTLVHIHHILHIYV